MTQNLIEIISDSEKEDWNNFVHTHPYGWMTHLFAWKDSIEASFPHVKGYFFALKEKERIVAGLPVFQVKSWLFGNRLISIPFATISDPLTTEAAQAKILIEHVLNFARDRGIENLQLRAMQAGIHLEKTAIPFVADKSYKQHYLLLDKNLDDLKKSFNKRNVRKRIRQAIENGLQARSSTSDADLKIFYNFYLKTRKRLGLPPQPFQFLVSLRDRFQGTDIFHLILAEKENRVLGGIIFFKYKDRVSAEIIAYEENYKNVHVSQFLYWQAILFAKEKNCRIFDFGRSSIYNEGLMKYKSHWGTELADLPIYYFSTGKRLNLSSREQSKMYRLLRAVGGKLPLGIFKLYGNFFYHHSA